MNARRLAAAALCLAAAGVAIGAAIPPLARVFRAKLDRIAANAATPPPYRDVTLTAAEADAYFASSLSPLPAAISNLRLASHGTSITGAADIDFDKLPRGTRPSFAGLVFSGVHHVTADAQLVTGLAPEARFTVTAVTLDGQRIPNVLIDLAIREFIAPKHPEISRNFAVPLPAHVRSISLGSDRATVHY